jgi:hypothetical protein
MIAQALILEMMSFEVFGRAVKDDPTPADSTPPCGSDPETSAHQPGLIWAIYPSM